MRILKRFLSLLLALLVIALFYVSAVLLEGEADKQGEQFIVEADTRPLTPGEALRGNDPQALADAFGVPLPVPEGFSAGQTADSRYHAYLSRQIELQGEKAAVRGVRPASAAPAILPKDLVFTASDKALLGYPLLQAQSGGATVYALVMKEAAFYIVPAAGDAPGGFSLFEPRL